MPTEIWFVVQVRQCSLRSAAREVKAEGGRRAATNKIERPSQGEETQIKDVENDKKEMANNAQEKSRI